MLNLPSVGVTRDWEQLWLNPKIAFKRKFWPHSAACGILVPPPGIEPTLPTVKCRVFTTGPLEKSPEDCILSLVELEALNS